MNVKMLKSATDARVDLMNNKIVIQRDIEIKTASLRYFFISQNTKTLKVIHQTKFESKIHISDAK